MAKHVNPGNLAFQFSLNSEIYIDKSMLISYTNKMITTRERFICVSRPRRFGKSMAAEMLVAYYSVGCSSRDMFAGLKIVGEPDFEKYLNKYNVIHLNVQNYLSESDNMDEMLELLEDDLIEELEYCYPDICMPKKRSLQRVLDRVFNDTKIPFIFIVDEWDCIFRVHRNNYDAQKQYLDFLRNLLKDQIYVALAYMTGILPIKKYGEHSALNMFAEFSMTNQRELAEYTGFTECEVEKLCEEYNMPFEKTKQWYDGYNVRGISVYNPRSVIMSMTGHDYDNYWTQTETYEALKVYIQMDFDGLKTSVVKMIAGEKVTINPAKFQNDMITFNSADDVLTLLVHLGYLTFDFDTKEVWIPNNEVRQEFINCIEDGGWESVMNAIRESGQLLEASLAGDEETVARQIEKIHQENTSILQYNDENSLSCVIALAYYSARKSYSVYRELPSGKGFADLVFIPDKSCKTPAMVVELKWNQSARTALTQIRDKNYTDGLKGYSGEVVLVGINYDKDSKVHTCQIEHMIK